MSDSSLQPDELHDFEPVDGVHELRQRRTTRLWYRAIQTEPVRLSPAPHAVPAIHAMAPVERETAILVADQLAEIVRIAIAAGKRAEAQPLGIEFPLESSEPLDWHVVPANCPALMLSASPTLGGHVSEAHLAPGVQFQVASIANGVAEVIVLNEDGETVRGYCNTVDLACADPERVSARPGSGKLRLPKAARFKMPSLAQTFGALR